MKELKQKINYHYPSVWKEHTKGSEIVTAVFDTGIMIHPDLEHTVLGWKDFVNQKEVCYDDNGHGTHIAGIIAGNGRCSNGIYAGIAPASRLVCVKVLDYAGNGKISDVIKGIQFVLTMREKWRIRIANISMGTKRHEGHEEEEQLLRWVEKMWDAGIVVITASGNFGPDYGSVTIPGISKKVITVGACDAAYDRRRPNPNFYSGCGPTAECVVKPDICAPGNRIYSCNFRYPWKSKKAYIAKTGTSMATPVIAGATALLLDKYPHMENVEVKMRLWESGDDMGLGENSQGHGRINIKKYLE